jgi:hypothetical protein
MTSVREVRLITSKLAKIGHVAPQYQGLRGCYERWTAHSTASCCDRDRAGRSLRNICKRDGIRSEGTLRTSMFDLPRIASERRTSLDFSKVPRAQIAIFSLARQWE